MSDLIVYGAGGDPLPDAQVLSLEKLSGRPTMGSWSNIPVKGENSVKLVLKAKKRGDRRSEDVINTTILVQYVYIHQVQLLNEQTGEVEISPRTVLFAPDGGTVSFCSQGIFDSLTEIIKWLGAGPWEPALLLRVSQVKTRRAHTLLTLDYEGLAPDVGIKPDSVSSKKKGP